MDEIKSMANMACEVSKYEGGVAISEQGRSICHKERPVSWLYDRGTLFETKETSLLYTITNFFCL